MEQWNLVPVKAMKMYMYAGEGSMPQVKVGVQLLRQFHFTPTNSESCKAEFNTPNQIS
jgi:hypothetical protein